jgi:hypothetical protein
LREQVLCTSFWTYTPTIHRCQTSIGSIFFAYSKKQEIGEGPPPGAKKVAEQQKRFQFLCDAALGRLDHHGSAIAENFGGAYHRPGVVSNTYHCIRTELSCVCDHQLKRFFSCSFTKIRKYSDSPTKEGPKSAQYTQRQ